MQLIDRVQRRTVPAPSGCLVWVGYRNDGGYGLVRVRGDRWHMVHVIAYEAAHGPVPDGLELDHLCRNRACVNVEHLEPVTHAENLRRGRSPSALNSLKDRCARGHAFDADNTYVWRGNRSCRACGRDRARAAYASRAA